MNAYCIPTPMPEDLKQAITHILDSVRAEEVHFAIVDFVDESFHDALETVRRHLVGITKEGCEEDLSRPSQVRGEGWSL